ncbi:MAG: diacylglycerol kinase family protein [Nonlabens sp.]
MISVRFLINPSSGKGDRKRAIKHLLSSKSLLELQVEVLYSQNAAHLKKLASAAVLDAIDVVVAAGGDGTVNIVASQLVNSEVALAILPWGSGNGLASHIGFTDSVTRMTSILKQPKFSFIDVGDVNHHYFFQNFALGLPATVIHRYNSTAGQGLKKYLCCTAATILKRLDSTIQSTDNTRPYQSLLVANSKFLGYGISLTPRASLQDGQLRVVGAYSKVNLFFRSMATLIFRKDYSRSLSELKIDSSPSVKAQIDGEIAAVSPPYEIRTHHKALKIVLPDSLSMLE